MKTRFDEILEDIKKQILEMGALVENAVEKAIAGLLEKREELFKEVFQIEEKINAKEIEIDQLCLFALARNAPVAADLRSLVAIIKMNNDLERMGDHAKTIAHNAREYIQAGELKPLIDIPKMAKEAQTMIHDALQAVVKEDVKLAREVISKDDTVDNFRSEILEELIALMEKKPETTRRAMKLISITRNLERLGDLATNIAEDVIYISTGSDIRHGGEVED